MNLRKTPMLAALMCIASLSYFSSTALTAQNPQNQTPAAPGNQTPGAPANRTPGAPANQTPGAPANQTPARPAEPPPVPGTPLHLSPGVVMLVQQKLLELGYPVPTVSGAWGELTGAAVAQYQRKQGLSAGGDLDELTLTALGMPEVLRGEIPAGGDQPVSASAAAAGGAPLSVSPRLTRVIQHQLTQSGFPTHNVLGIWIAAIDNAPRNFQKAKGLDITNTLDLQLLHALGLIDAFLTPQPGTLPTDAVADILSDQTRMMTGTPLTISAFGIRQVQTALAQRGHKGITADGKWSEGLTAELKKFQEAQKLEPTGNLNLRTLRALGFDNPLRELDQPTAGARTAK